MDMVHWNRKGMCWTKSLLNPIITRTETTVSGPGHNSVAPSPDDSELFALYHTHLNFEGGGSCQLAIDRLEFVPNQTQGQPDHLKLKTGYPTTSLQPLPSGAVPSKAGTSDDFDIPTLDRERWYVFWEDRNNWMLQYGQLEIQTQRGDIHQSSLDAQNIFLQYAPDGDFDIETRVNFTPAANYEQAFLILWENQSNFIRFSSVHADGAKMEVGIESDGYYYGTLYPNSWGQYLRLKIQRRGDTYTLFAGSAVGQSWTQIGAPIAFPTVQPKVGLGAISPISGAT